MNAKKFIPTRDYLLAFFGFVSLNQVLGENQVNYINSYWTRAFLRTSSPKARRLFLTFPGGNMQGLNVFATYQVWRRWRHRHRWRREETHCGGRVVRDGREESLPLGQLQPGGHLLLPLCPPVLEPRLDLHLRQVQRLGELEAFRDGEVLVGLELETKWA